MSAPDEVADSVALHRLLPLGRFGDDNTDETFTSPDGRVGTVTCGPLARGGIDSVMTVREIRLPSDAGSVLTMGMCSDPAQRQELAVLTAFALSMTQYLVEGVEPELPARAQSESSLDSE